MNFWLVEIWILILSQIFIVCYNISLMETLHSSIWTLASYYLLFLEILLIKLMVEFFILSMSMQSFQIHKQIFKSFFIIAIKSCLITFCTLKLLLLLCHNHLSISKSAIISREDFTLNERACWGKTFVTSLLNFHSFLSFYYWFIEGTRILAYLFYLILRNICRNGW